MPRKTKEEIEEIEEKPAKKVTRSKKATTEKKSAEESSSKKSALKDTVEKEVPSKKVSAKKVSVKEPAKEKAAKKASTKKISVKEPAKEKAAKKASTKKTSVKEPAKEKTAKKASTKKTSVKETTKEKAVAKKVTASKTSKKTSTKSTTTKKTELTKKSSTSSKVSKKAAEKKSPSKEDGETKRSAKEISKSKSPIEVLEYYDLPYRYNQTVVRILAQTPTTLFVYWDISDEDKEQYIKQYGEYFFNNTKPVLIIHNKSMNYSFEIDINDFANSWYLHVNDSNCDYQVELGRRPINQYVEIPNNYLHIVNSNNYITQNDHILFEKLSNFIYFRNVKTNETIVKNIANFTLLQKVGKFDVKKFYEKLYPDGVFNFEKLHLGNPSSR